MIPLTVRKGDAVLEVGCHLGTTTILLKEAAIVSSENGTKAGYAIGVDVGPKIIEGAKKRYPGVPFAVGDAWKIAELLRLQKSVLEDHKEDVGDLTRKIGFDVVFVDVGGLSGNDGLLEALTLLTSLINGLEPRCLVIKSQCIRKLSSSLVSYWQYQKIVH
mmetsp:Transcript_33404/g.69558  ORF Transcript_33404/g.69558 Transcript_33404/m.69558 type:complete len:161 (-) Transcript_33404:145-627(-)